MAGGMFRWAAPVFARVGSRWSMGDADDLVRAFDPYVPAGGRLLDVGGGTGALATRLAERLRAAVTVLDASPHMLRHAEGLPGVTAVGGDAEAMPFEDGVFDAVLVSDAFHHFTTPPVAAREMARVVRPGGGVVVLEPDPAIWAVRLVAGAECLAGEPGHFMKPAVFEELMRGAGVEGAAHNRGKASYVFVGTVTGVTAGVAPGTVVGVAPGTVVGAAPGTVAGAAAGPLAGAGAGSVTGEAAAAKPSREDVL